MVTKRQKREGVAKPIKIEASFDSAMDALLAVETRRKKKRKAKK